MEIQFRQDINQKSMLIRKEEKEKESYCEKMVLKNSIPGLLRVSLQHIDGVAWYSYDIRSRQSLKHVFTGNPLSYKELLRLLQGFKDIITELGHYLLKASDLLVRPDIVFWDLEMKKPEFCYYPDSTESEESYMDFAQFLIDSVDQNDVLASKLAYDYFNLVSDGIYAPDTLLKVTPVPEKIYSPMEPLSYTPEPATEEALPLDKLWEEDKQNYYLSQDNNNPLNTEEPKKSIWISLAICLGLSLLAGGLYIFLISHPEILLGLGISDRNYVLLGAIIAAVFAGAILGLIHLYNRSIAKKAEELAFERSLAEDSSACDFQPDRVEEEQIQAEQKKRAEPADNGETVLLTSFMAGGGGAQPPRLTGQIDGGTKSFYIDHSPFMIGKLKGRADGLIPKACISRIHACIREEKGHYFISDLNSTNGTRLNERLLEQNETAELNDGDELRFADVAMRFRLT